LHKTAEHVHMNQKSYSLLLHSKNQPHFS